MFSTKRACPSCGTSFAELDPRLFSFNSKHGWCEAVSAPGSRCAGFDEEQSGEELWWNEWYDARAAALQRAATGSGSTRSRCNVRFRERSIAALAREAGRARAGSSSPGSRLGHARARDRARPAWPRSRAPDVPRSASASATCSSIAPRRRSRAARRSASASPRSSARTCRACATCSTSRPSACIRATTQVLLDALSRARRSAQHAGGGRARRETPSAAPTHVHGPRAAGRRARRRSGRRRRRCRT